MAIKFYNTLTRKKEEFAPLKPGAVSMYHCGPTVYDHVHIGNLRAYLLADMLRRVFEETDYEVQQVMNITDVGHLVSDGDEGEDKMTKAIRREGKELTLESMYEVGTHYTDIFLEDIKKLNIQTPMILPRASDHIEGNIKMIQTLEEKGFAYATSDGVYFDTSQVDTYGELAKLDIEGIEEGARVNANSEKKNPADFALWKFDSERGWESPWGKGFPGWHIECSTMSMHYLGETIDIHTGGVDNMAPHHTNEIAQSEAATEKPFVNYWLHNGWVMIEGKKMSKSLGNLAILDTIIEKGFNPLSFRYWLLTAHYRTQIDFTWEALEGAQTALIRLYEHYSELEKKPQEGFNTTYYNTFIEHIHDDLDTPGAIALLWKLIKDTSVDDAVKKATIEKFDTILGLGFRDYKEEPIPEEILKIAEERDHVRGNQDWETSDLLRTRIEEQGFTVKDTSEGQKITKS